MDKFTDGKYNIGVNHEHLCLALRRLNNLKLNNLSKIKLQVLRFIYQIVIYTLNLNIDTCLQTITLKPYLRKQSLVFGFHQKGCLKLVYISVLVLLMVNNTLSNLIKNSLKVLILNILKAGMLQII